MSHTVLLADDHTLVRAGLRALLEGLPEVSVVLEASDGHEALAAIAAHHPDVVLMDIAMPGLNGLEAAAVVSRDHPGTRTIVLSMHGTDAYVVQALRAGAAGYLLKDAAVAELPLALRAVLRGEVYISSAVSRLVVNGFLAGMAAADAQPASPLDVLSARQREILQLIAEGHSTKEMAFRLKLSVKTVETHRRQVMERLQIFDIPGLVRLALRHGLVRDNT
jgi:DNA-binding NarL/FixJ family response regulator